VTITVPYVVKDHNVLHTISAEASYEDNPHDTGDTAVTSFTGTEVIEPGFFDFERPEWGLLIIVIILVIVIVASMFFMMRRLIAMAPAPAPAALPVTDMTFAGLEKVGMDQVQWDDDSF
jgi:hypothetical protein